MRPGVHNAITDVPVPANEPVHDHAPGSGERTRLTDALTALAEASVNATAMKKAA